MKRLFMTFLVLTATASLALAADMAVAPGANTPGAPMATEKTLVGTVKSVSVADAAKGTKSEIVVTDIAGKTTDVLVKGTSTMYDADAKATTLDKIAVGSKVSTVYMTSPEGMNEAKSVKILK